MNTFIVQWIKPKRKFFGKLKAITTDGEHGVANCQFPEMWNGISRSFLPNEGKMFEVSKVTWNGSYYVVDKEDIIREIIIT